MVIVHNLPAMNIQRQFNISMKKSRKSTEKLSSGYRINRSADDAAGLSISEKMRNQIRGLNQAVRNIEDGISLIRTADGALNEVHSILHRMGELAVKSANDINTDKDRQIVNDEVEELKVEIQDIFEKTEFNGKGLFTATALYAPMLSGDWHVGVTSQGRRSIKQLDVGEVLDDAYNYFTSAWNVKEDGAGNYEFSFSVFDKKSGNMLSNFVDSVSKTVFRKECEREGYVSLKLEDMLETEEVLLAEGGNRDYTNLIIQFCKFQPSQPDLKINDPVQYEAELTAHEMKELQELKDANVSVILDYYSGTMERPIMRNMVLQTGANAGDTTIMNWKSLNLDVIGIEDTNTLTYRDSQNAINEVQRAIRLVSAERSKFGSIQNRLEIALTNNQNYAENLQSAEAGIRDTDMETEVLVNTKHNILEQIAQAMLAQANQNNQSVLNLLQ